MAAQRGAVSVTAVDIDADAVLQARQNAAASAWANKVEVICQDIATFNTDIRFDRIVCNPPFFRDSLRSPDAGRNTARHNDSLSFETLAQRAASLLAPGGRFCLVLPYDAVEVFIRCAAAAGLDLCRRTDVLTAPGKTPKRSLVAFGKNRAVLDTDVLQMCGPDGKETPQYVELVKDFYLKY